MIPDAAEPLLRDLGSGFPTAKDFKAGRRFVFLSPTRALAAAAADLDVGGEDAALTLAAWTLWSRAEDFAAVGDEDLLS